MVDWWETENSLLSPLYHHHSDVTHPVFNTSLWFISHLHLGESLHEGADSVGWERCPLQAGLGSVSCLFFMARCGQSAPLVSGSWCGSWQDRGALPRWLTQEFDEVSCLRQMSWRCVLIDVRSVGSRWRHRPRTADYVSGALGNLALVLPPVWTTAVSRWPSFSTSPLIQRGTVSWSGEFFFCSLVFMSDFYHSFLHCRLAASLLLCMNQIMHSDWPKPFAVPDWTRP